MYSNKVVLVCRICWNGYKNPLGLNSSKEKYSAIEFT